MARAAVLVSFVAAWVLVEGLHLVHASPRLRQGLMAWDGQWYLGIAEHGYAAIPTEALRFFPLYPLMGRLFGVALLGRPGLALLLLANTAALAFGALVHRLCLFETGDRALARRSTWLVALTPAAFVLAWAYSEALFGCLAVGTFLALRKKRWYWASALGGLAGLMRPVGALLALPAVVEAARDRRSASGAEWLGRLSSVVAPGVGAVSYLAWVGIRFGDPLLPMKVQQQPYLRGAPADPISVLWRAGGRLLTGHLEKNSLAFPWALILIVLAVLAFRHWPASYGAFCAATVGVALSTSRLGSLERYGFFAFPIVLTLATVVRTKKAERTVIALGAVAIATYGALALLGGYVP